MRKYREMEEELFKFQEMASTDGAIALSPIGAGLVGTPTEDELNEYIMKVAGADRACKFMLGDLMNIATELFGSKYQLWSRITGREVKNLRNIASVCKRVPFHSRRRELPFSLHDTVAKLDTGEQERWLDEAVGHELTRDKLKKSIELGRVAKDEDMDDKPERLDPYDQGTDNPHPHISRLVTLYGRLEREGDLDAMSPGDLYRLHLDLLPLLQKYVQILGRIERGASPEAGMIRVDLLNYGLEFHSSDAIDVEAQEVEV